MPNLTLTVGQLKITPLFWSLFLAGILSSFSLWRKLKEDFKEEEIFTLTLLVLAACFLCSWLLIQSGDKRLFTLNFFLFSCFWVNAGVIKLWASGKKKNVWEVYDGFVMPFFYFLFLAGLGAFFKNGDFRNLGYCFVGFIVYLVNVYSRRRYRSFSWYKSGKTGFLFWEASLSAFLLLTVLAFLRKTGLYWEGSILAGTALVCFGLLYYRSERNLLEDLKKKKRPVLR